jgi:hypothetical protein
METKSVSIKLAILEVKGSFPTKASRKKLISEHTNAHLSLMYLGTLTSHTSLVQLLRKKTIVTCLKFLKFLPNKNAFSVKAGYFLTSNQAPCRPSLISLFHWRPL